MNDKIFKQFDISDLKRARQKRTSRKISERVFDNVTLYALDKLQRRGAFDTIESIVSTGKEANVYHGLRDGESVALKIYCTDTSDFKNMGEYVRGDPRFPAWKNKRHLINLWTQKEYKNLMRVHEKIRCPIPIDFINNVLVMEFIGDLGNPAPRLKDDLGNKTDKKIYGKIKSYLKIIYKLGLVHGDLSEYNILDFDGPVIIDFSAGVLHAHPRSDEFLRRDIHNIVNFFTDKQKETEEEKVYSYVTKK